MRLERAMSKKVVIHVIFPIIIGIVFHIFFREIAIFRGMTNLMILIEKVHGITCNIQLPEIIQYSFTDTVWMYSLSYLIFYIWRKYKNSNIFVFSGCIIIAILIEILQLKKIIVGTFDYNDIFMMSIAVLISFLAIKNEKEKREYD